MYVINPHGRKVSVTPEMWEELKKKKGFRLAEKKYTEDYLNSLEWNDLRKIASDEDINIYSKKKEEIIQALLELEG